MFSLFLIGGSMKIANAFGCASNDYKKFHANLNPLVMQTPLLSLLPIPHRFFFLVVGLVEVVGALALLVRPKVASLAFVAVTVGAEYATNAISSSQFNNPLCYAASACTASSAVHVYLIALSLAIYVFDDSLPVMLRRVQEDHDETPRAKID
jgi:uncharacterized membrane protein YphA (DoxX/SURF4 family)